MDTGEFAELAQAACSGDATRLAGLKQRYGDLDSIRTEHTRETVLHYLAIEGHADAVTLLAKYGADVNSRASSESTPLIDAARIGKLEMVKILVSLGADLNAVDNNLDTALHHAAGAGHVTVVQYLLSEGATPNLRNSLDETSGNQCKPINPEIKKLFPPAE